MNTRVSKCRFRALPRWASVLQPGFSLPEVTIAVAIAALGLVSVLGLLPTGLENVRVAGNNIATSRILQEMISEIQSADWGTLASGSSGSNVGNWNKLTNYNNSRRFFDGEGTLIGSSQGTNLSNADGMKLAYVAKFEFVPLAPTQILSGGSGAPDAGTRTDLLRVVIHIVSTTNQNFDFSTTTFRKDRVDRAFTISRQF
jgi:uncharacterized protein (TIGR02598 family)